MSLGFELAQAGSANQYANAFGDAKPIDQVTPGVMEGFSRAVGMGVVRGGVNLARMASMAGSVLPIAADKLTGGTRQQDEYFDTHDRVFNRASEFWTPRPDEVGSAGRIVGGLAEIALPLILGRGNPAPLMASAGLNTGEDLVRQGVDPTNAGLVGVTQATAIGAGFKLPFLGRNLAERVAFGAASNVATSMVAQGASSQLLKASGYAKQAEQFDPLDVEGRVVDALMGAVFGGIAHGFVRREARLDAASEKRLTDALNIVPDSSRDALLAANNARHADVDTAPGRPRTFEAANEHADALAQAMDDLDAGRPVTASVPREAFDKNPQRDDFRAAITQATDDVRGKALPPEPREPVRAPEPATDAVPVVPEPDATALAPRASAGAETPPEITAAQRAAEARPDLAIPLDDGTVVRAADALAKAEEVVRQAQTESRAFEAAVSCILRG